MRLPYFTCFVPFILCLGFPLLSQNIPPSNLGFESGTFEGWQGSIQARNSGTGSNGIPGPVQNGFLQHCLMSPEMKDPYFEDLLVVPPGKTHAIRLGNVSPGGDYARLHQSFLVDSSHAFFSFQASIVLEGAEDVANHLGLASPHFYVRVIDSKGETDHCNELGIVSEANIPGFHTKCVEADDARFSSNTGCPVGALGADGSPTPVPLSVQNAENGACNTTQARIMYYCDWTQYSFDLRKHIGKQITVEFTMADCEPKGHLAYAYLHSESLQLPRADNSLTLQSASDSLTLLAPKGFYFYSWTNETGTELSFDDSLVVKKAGTYHVSYAHSNSPTCAYTLSYWVNERLVTGGLSKISSQPLNLYPNPAKELFFVELPKHDGLGDYQLKMLDLTGKEVQTDVQRDGSTLKVARGTTPKGMYLLDLRTENGTYSAKLMIE